MPCVGNEVLAKKLTQPVVVSRALRRDVIISKENVLECHGVNWTTLGDFPWGWAPIIFIFICQRTRRWARSTGGKTNSFNIIAPPPTDSDAEDTIGNGPHSP